MRIQLQELVDSEISHYQTYLLYSCQQNILGLKKLSKLLEEESKEELGHLKSLLDRMLFLEYSPEFSLAERKIVSEDNIIVQYNNILKMETDYLIKVKDSIHRCHIVDDYGTEEVLEKIIIDGENQIDWVQEQLQLIDKLGEQLYCSTMI